MAKRCCWSRGRRKMRLNPSIQIQQVHRKCRAPLNPMSILLPQWCCQHCHQQLHAQRCCCSSCSNSNSSRAISSSNSDSRSAINIPSHCQATYTVAIHVLITPAAVSATRQQ